MIFGKVQVEKMLAICYTTSLASGLFQRACIESAEPVISDYTDAKRMELLLLIALLIQELIL